MQSGGWKQRALRDTGRKASVRAGEVSGHASLLANQEFVLR